MSYDAKGYLVVAGVAAVCGGVWQHSVMATIFFFLVLFCLYQPRQ